MRIRATTANGKGEWGYISVRPIDRPATPARAAARLANASDFARYPPALAAGAAPTFSPSFPLLVLSRAATLSVLGRGSELTGGSCYESADLRLLLSPRHQRHASCRQVPPSSVGAPRSALIVTGSSCLKMVTLIRPLILSLLFFARSLYAYMAYVTYVTLGVGAVRGLLVFWTLGVS